MSAHIGYPHRYSCAHTGTVCARTELAGRSHVEQSSELAVRREVWHVGSLLCCVCASGMPRTDGIPPQCGIHHMFPAWTTRNAHMGSTLAHAAHSHVRARKGACADARVRVRECAMRAATVSEGCIRRRGRVHACAALSGELRIGHRKV